MILFALISLSCISAADNIASDETIAQDGVNTDEIVAQTNLYSEEKLTDGENEISDFSTLNAEIANSTTSTIQLTKNYTYNSEKDSNYTDGIVIDKPDFTIDGQGHTINGAGLARIFHITTNTVTLKNIKFINGNATDNGGAIYWEGTNGTINNCNFTNNQANLRGGAVFWSGVNGTINNSNFINNTATRYSGGAIQWDSNSANGTINNCNFTNNQGSQRGGAIYWNSVNGRIDNSNFVNNTSIDGGALFCDSNAPDGYVNNSNFIENNGNDGGAIYWYGANGRMNGCDFIKNRGSNGGAINWQRTYGLVNNCKFINNTAQSNGGAIAITSDGDKVDNAKLINNTAAKSGGAIYVGGNDVVISNSELSVNSASDGTDNVAIGLDGKYSLIDNVTSDKYPIISFVTEINATSGGDVYWGDDPVIINIKTNAKGGNVSITIEGKTYNGSVKEGVATISIPDLIAGTYRDVVVSYHDSTGDYGDARCNVTFTVNASKAKIINKNVKVDYNSNYKYKIMIIGVDGNPVNGVEIKISINAKVKTYKTDSKGYITIKLDKTYTPGKYTVKLSYKGKSSKHVITVKQILKSKKVVKVKKNAKKAVLKAQLKSGNGKAIKGKKITFKVKGKTYKVKTNKKGIAKITLKNKVIKKFKAGKTYTVKITYLKDTIKTKLKVKK